MSNFDQELLAALEEDGKKLEQLTGENHGPFCLECGGTGLRDSGGNYPWGESIFIPCDCEDDTE